MHLLYNIRYCHNTTTTAGVVVYNLLHTPFYPLYNLMATSVYMITCSCGGTNHTYIAIRLLSNVCLCGLCEL